MTPPPVLTARLTIVPATQEILRADASDRRRLPGLLAAAVPASWPQPMYGDALKVLDAWVKPQDLQTGWAVWYILLRGHPPATPTPPTLIGTIGFKGSPDKNGRVEIGYGIVEDHQRRGYASEAALAMTQHAFQRGARSVIAHTFERLTPSIGVLTKCGFRCVGPGFEQVSEEEARGMGKLLLFQRDA